jgi:hypothetical protein
MSLLVHPKPKPKPDVIKIVHQTITKTLLMQLRDIEYLHLDQCVFETHDLQVLQNHSLTITSAKVSRDCKLQVGYHPAVQVCLDQVELQVAGDRCVLSSELPTGIVPAIHQCSGELVLSGDPDSLWGLALLDELSCRTLRLWLSAETADLCLTLMNCPRLLVLECNAARLRMPTGLHLQLQTLCLHAVQAIYLRSIVWHVYFPSLEHLTLRILGYSHIHLSDLSKLQTLNVRGSITLNVCHHPLLNRVWVSCLLGLDIWDCPDLYAIQVTTPCEIASSLAHHFCILTQ